MINSKLSFRVLLVIFRVFVLPLINPVAKAVAEGERIGGMTPVAGSVLKFVLQEDSAVLQQLGLVVGAGTVGLHLVRSTRQAEYGYVATA